jgi:hypothetical protein
MLHGAHAGIVTDPIRLVASVVMTCAVLLDTTDGKADLSVWSLV